MSTLLDRFTNDLLPGNDHWPAAAEIEVGVAMQQLASTDSEQKSLFDRLLDFLENHKDRPALAEILEVKDSELFGFAKVLAFEAYYINPQVREVIARRSMYANRPPQPAGFPVVTRTVAPWNEDEILWRSDGTECSNEVLIEQKKDPKKTWTVEEIRKWRH
ncbi:MAG: hypothetical protein WCJ91_08620 [Actinomycetes bacterium]